MPNQRTRQPGQGEPAFCPYCGHESLVEQENFDTTTHHVGVGPTVVVCQNPRCKTRSAVEVLAS